MRVLIIDDDAGTRGIIRLVLNRDFEDTEIVEAENGLEGLGHLDGGQRFDLVVLDLQMPVMDGLEALEALRASASHAEVPVIVLTGEASAENVRKVLALGISAYLTKPVNLGKLSARIAAIRDGSLQRLGEDATGASSQDEPIAEPRCRVLVIDGDEAFRRALRTGMGGRAEVVESETGSHALQVLLADGGANPPVVVVIGTSTGMLGGDLLARKIRKLSLAAAPRLICAGGADVLESAGRSGLYDHVVPHGAAAGQLAEQVSALCE